MSASTTDFMLKARPPQNMRNTVFYGTGTQRLFESAYMVEADGKWKDSNSPIGLFRVDKIEVIAETPLAKTVAYFAFSFFFKTSSKLRKFGFPDLV